MSSKTFRAKLFKIVTHGVTACCSASITYYFVKRSKDKEAALQWLNDYTPSAKWDYNWDKLEPTSLVQPLADNSDPEKENKYNEKLEQHKSKAVRHLILIRHGQYHTKGKTDLERFLTPLGRQQAELTGNRLQALDLPYTSILHSTMTRAIETATLIHKYLPNVPITSCSLLEEGAPIQPEPPVSYWKPEKSFFRDGPRIEAAFRKHFHRAPPSQKKDSYEIIVAHANVIRYFVCRALQFPPEGWLRILLCHASITALSILPSGTVVISVLGDAGFMPVESISHQALQLPPEAWLRLSLSHASLTTMAIHPNGRVALITYGDIGFMPVSHVTRR